MALPMDGLQALRDLVNPPPPEPDPSDKLLEIAKVWQEDAMSVDEWRHRKFESEVAKTDASEVSAGRLLDLILAPTVDKTMSREEPPGLHHTSGRRNCTGCLFYERPECHRYNWQVDPDEVCASWQPIANRGALSDGR
jgi:hypothetical protein